MTCSCCRTFRILSSISHIYVVWIISFFAGPYKSESLPLSLKSSNALYKEKYVLVVDKMEPSIMDTLALPFRPFENSTWALILFVTLSLAALLKIINGSGDDPDSDIDGMDDKNTSKMKGLLCRATSSVINSIYHAIRGFTSGSLDERKIENFSSSVKLVSTGFVLFVFFVVIAYSGSSAASFVNDTGGARYDVILNIIVSCIFCPLY